MVLILNKDELEFAQEFLGEFQKEMTPEILEISRELEINKRAIEKYKNSVIGRIQTALSYIF